MNTRNKLWMTFVASSTLLTACLDSSDSATSSGADGKSGMDVVASSDDLPECETANNGEQVYVTDERMARVCVNGKWQAVGSNSINTVYVSTTCETKLLKDSSGVKIICGGDSIGVVKNGARGLQGEKGDTGAQGIQGEKGEQGVQGAKGDKGDAGADGTGCTMEMLKDASGLKVICNGDSVGVVLNGAKGAKGDQGDTGATGLSAYDVAVAGGYTGTETEWLASLKGAKGDQGTTGATGLSAYEVAVAGGYTGTEAEWVASLKGEKGDQGETGADGTGCVMEMLADASGLKVICNGDSVGVVLNGSKGETGATGLSAYDVAVAVGFTGTEEEWLASLKGAKGDPGETGASGLSAYDVAVAGGYTGTEEEWLASLKGAKGDPGETGASGLSAYDVAVAGGYTGTEEEWLASLKGAKGDPGETGASGLSAYEIAVAGGYAGTEEEWIASLKGEKGDQGETGSGCTATAFSSSSGSGYNIVCGGTVVGQVKNGVKGDKGDQGDPCTAVALDDGSGYKVMCGEDSVGVLKHGSGCHVTRTASDTLLVICGADTVLAKKYAWDEGDAPEGAVILSTNFDLMTDGRDGQVYKTVVIGGQTWMAQNLNYNYNVGSAKSYCYNLLPMYCEQYGRLYTYSAAMDSAGLFSDDAEGCGSHPANDPCRKLKVQGICPDGWRMPNDDDWTILINMIAANPYELDDPAIYDWPYALGFDFKFAGARGDNESNYGFIDEVGSYWSSTVSSSGEAYRKHFVSGTATGMWDAYSYSLHGYIPSSHAHSVRCIKKEVGE